MWTLEMLKGFRLSHDGRRMEYCDEQWRLPSPEDVLEWFKLLQAGWVYGGDPRLAHAILHSGMHSDGFFLCKKVLDHGNLREIIAACMIAMLRGVGLGEVDGVFGSPQSSILLSGDVGRLLGVKTYVLEKDPKDSEGKKMLFKPDDPVPEGHVLLQIEELVTTWASGGASTDAIIAGNPYPVKFAPLVGVFVLRPPELEYVLPDGRVMKPFIERPVAAWPKDSCPLCARGSRAVKPKTDWAVLTSTT